MRTITTQELIERERPLELGLADQGLMFGERPVPTADVALELSDDHRKQLGDVIDRALDNFHAADETPEPTLAQAVAGLPTLIARVDCTLSPNGDILPFEVEERPNGLGVIHQLLESVGAKGLKDSIHDHYQQLVGSLPVVGLSSGRVFGSDDGIVLPTVALDRLPDNNQPVLLRVEPNELSNAEHERLVGRSVATIRSEGSKRYAARLGLAELTHSAQQLPGTDTSFVVKPIQGSKSQGVRVHLSKADKQRLAPDGSGITRHHKVLSHAAELITQAGACLCEPLKVPMPAVMPDGRHGNMILRVLALTGSSNGTEVIGGAFVARREMVVHGASNAVSGAVLVQ